MGQTPYQHASYHILRNITRILQNAYWIISDLNNDQYAMPCLIKQSLLQSSNKCSRSQTEVVKCPVTQQLAVCPLTGILRSFQISVSSGLHYFAPKCRFDHEGFSFQKAAAVNQQPENEKKKV